MLSNSPAQTRAIGQALAQQLRPGDVLLLLGDLGAGKSELTRGLARGLGVTATVSSPSFTILNVYDDGTLPLYHFDWYRLESSEELYELGMEEYLGGDGVAVVGRVVEYGDAQLVRGLHIDILQATAVGQDVFQIGCRLHQLTGNGAEMGHKKICILDGLPDVIGRREGICALFFQLVCYRAHIGAVV